jgi:hypothetical protein
MIRPWRPLVAVAVNLTLGAGVATAQTVLIRHAPQAESIEVVLNDTKVSSGTVGADGEATLPLDLSRLSKTEIDANVFVDDCENLHRVIVVERTKLPDPQQPGCARRDIPGLYWVRPLNTLVFDLGGPTPTLLLIKGRFKEPTPHTWTLAPSGLMVFGGGAFTNVTNEVAVACGTVTDCSGKSSTLGFTAGVTYWIKPFLGVEATYTRPQKITAQGSGDTFSFNSSLDPQIATAVGKVGIPIGPVRLYGTGGMNYHDTTSLTTQTINGVSQSFTFKTKDWGWVFGGGMEVWLARSFALYTDLNFAQLQGSDEAGTTQAAIDDRARYLTFGARIHIGR